MLPVTASSRLPRYALARQVNMPASNMLSIGPSRKLCTLAT